MAAGLNGKAQAVSVAGDNPVTGAFAGTISDAAAADAHRRRRQDRRRRHALAARVPLRARPAGHRSTGIRGYLGKRSSVFDRSHIENELPRVLAITFWWTQLSQSPAGGAPGLGLSGLMLRP